MLLISHWAAAEPDRQNTSHLRLSPNGAIGAWLVSGPCEDLHAIPPTLRPGSQGACAGARWRTISKATGEFDWAELLDVKANAPAASAVGLWLYVEKPFDGWLLVSADGRLRVSVDGRWVHERDKPRQRGRGFVPIALALSSGFHPIWLALERSANRSSFSVLLRDRQTNQAPSDALLYLPSGAAERQLMGPQLLVNLDIPLRKWPQTLDVDLRFPATSPPRDLPIDIELHQESRRHWRPGTLFTKAHGDLPLKVHLGPLDGLTSSAQSNLLIQLGDLREMRKIWLTPAAVASLERGLRARSLPIVQRAAQSRHDALGASLEASCADVAAKMLQPSREGLDLAVRRLDAMTTQLERGDDPLAAPGYVNAFIRSPFDGRPTSVLTYVPADFSPAAADLRPLVVVLHGYNSNPQRILDAFLDSHNPKAASKVDGFVLAPDAYGNTFYRGAGEHAVLDAIEWATTAFPIDKTRISITGVSMGGTGSAEIAFGHSELFSAAAPLCGYHSYFVRRDTANIPLRAWERRLMHRFSPASHAESGNDIPLFVAHGTKDRPLENSRSLTTRYRSLGYNLTEDWPDLGHAVWKKTYAQASMYSWLARWRKDLDPPRVVLATSSRRQGKKFWLELTGPDILDKPASIDARISSPGEVEVKTSGVAGFRIGNSRHLDQNRAVGISIDGSRLVVEVNQARHFALVDGRWQLANELAASRGPRLEGPWSELWSEPLVVVYGTLDPTTVALNREIAKRLVEPRAGVALAIPVVADQQFSPTTSPLTRVIYVGHPRDHQHLASIANLLPIRLTPTAVELAGHRFTEPDVGVAFVYPDPNRRERLLGIVSGNGPEGLWRVLALPSLLPDFVVFDHGTDAAAGDPVLGSAAYLRAAGFFRSDWTLPDDPLDPLAPVAR